MDADLRAREAGSVVLIRWELQAVVHCREAAAWAEGNSVPVDPSRQHTR